MRWNLLFLIFDFLIIPLPLWIDIFSPIFAAAYSLFISWLGALLLSLCAWKSLQANRLMLQAPTYGREFWGQEYRAEHLQHLVMMCGYKEPMEVIQQSIDSLVSQTVAHRLIVVIGLEEGTPEVAEKASNLKKQYAGAFKRFHVTKHPPRWAGDREIRGKCSNANYTMRAAVTRLEEYGELNLACTTATSCDTDSIFPPRYFENLGYQIPFNINTMSIFSFSLDLCIKGDFFHAHYQMDDIIYTLTCMQALQKRIEILGDKLFISGPTSGSTYCEEIQEFVRQSERWTIGACEVFHYFVVKRRRYNCSAALSYGIWFVTYYGFILCSLTLSGLAAFLNYAIVDAKQGLFQQSPLDEKSRRLVVAVGLASLAWTYLIFLIFFYLDRAACKLIYHLKMKPQGSEDASLGQNLKDWVLMWPSLVMYSCVSAWAILKVAIYGKKVCGHDPSSKEALRPRMMEPAVFMFTKHVGPYANVGQVFDKLSPVMPPKAKMAMMSLEPRRRRSAGEGLPMSKREMKAGRVKVTAFPLRGPMSFMLGPMKIYPTAFASFDPSAPCCGSYTQRAPPMAPSCFSGCAKQYQGLKGFLKPLTHGADAWKVHEIEAAAVTAEEQSLASEPHLPVLLGARAPISVEEPKGVEAARTELGAGADRPAALSALTTAAEELAASPACSTPVRWNHGCCEVQAWDSELASAKLGEAAEAAWHGGVQPTGSTWEANSRQQSAMQLRAAAPPPLNISDYDVVDTSSGAPTPFRTSSPAEMRFNAGSRPAAGPPAGSYDVARDAQLRYALDASRFQEAPSFITVALLCSAPAATTAVRHRRGKCLGEQIPGHPPALRDREARREARQLWDEPRAQRGLLACSGLALAAAGAAARRARGVNRRRCVVGRRANAAVEDGLPRRAAIGVAGLAFTVLGLKRFAIDGPPEFDPQPSSLQGKTVVITGGNTGGEEPPSRVPFGRA
eukprot:g12871.t1